MMIQLKPRPWSFLVLWALVSSASAQISNSAETLERARAAKTLTEAIAVLGIANPEPGPRILLEAPDIVVAKRSFPIKVISRTPGTDWIAMFVEHGPKPLLELKEYSPGVDHQLTAVLQLEQTTRIRAIVRSGGRYYQATREVKVAKVETAAR